MLPNPDRIAADRRLHVGLCCAWLLLTGPVVYLTLAGWPRLAVLGIVGLVALLWYWLGMARWRRRQALLARPEPEHLHASLRRLVPYYARLSAPTQARFRHMTRIFRAEVAIRGVDCLLEEDDKLLVAASAVIPVLGLPAWEYEGLRQVLVYPSGFDAAHFGDPDEDSFAADGMVSETGLLRGTLMLSLDSLREGFTGADDGHVGIHEFAHLIDRGDGLIDGGPPGMSKADRDRWRAVLARAFRRRGRRRRSRRLLRAYGYHNEQEFFAVLSEYFFTQPEELRERDAEIFELCCRIYRQRPPTD